MRTAPRAVIDTNVLVAAAIAPDGTCGQLLAAAVQRRWTMLVSPRLLDELSDVLARPKFRRWLTDDDATVFVGSIRILADVRPDPASAPSITRDPNDDYIVALSRAIDAEAIISGDPHLTELIDLDPPVWTPASFLAHLDS